MNGVGYDAKGNIIYKLINGYGTVIKYGLYLYEKNVFKH